MANSVLSLAQNIGELLDLIGVFVIVGGAAVSVFIELTLIIQQKAHNWYKSFRQNLGHSILLGLEFLVAGDIIRSITGTPSFEAVGVLVVIVLVRSFLSVTFEMEIEGRWPWQRNRTRI